MELNRSVNYLNNSCEWPAEALGLQNKSSKESLPERSHQNHGVLNVG